MQIMYTVAKDFPSDQMAQEVQGTQVETGSALELIKSIGGAAGFLTGLAFVNGWLYWAAYYEAFGLNPLVLDLSATTISVSPLWVVLRDLRSEYNSLFGAVLIVGTGVCIGLALLFGHWCADKRRYAIIPLICLAAIMSFGALELGLHDAELDAGCQSRLPDLAFHFKGQPDPAEPPPDCTGSERCKLLIHTGDVYHYFVTPDPAFCNGVMAGQFATGEVFESDLSSVGINRNVGW
jgi:hypothetical protein